MPRRIPLLRTVTVGIISLAVLLSAALYLVDPTRLALAVDVSTQRFHPTSGAEVLFGRATNVNHSAVSGVRLTLLSPFRPNSRLMTSLVDEPHGRLRTYRLLHEPVVSLISGTDGTYRTTLNLVAGQYTLIVQAHLPGQRTSTTTSTAIQLLPGHTYRVDVSLRRSGLFFFLPVYSY